MEKKVCSVCGNNPVYKFYGMCKECLTKKQNGQLIKCETCGTWYDKDKYCPHCNPNNKLADLRIPNTCLICGDETTDGYHFCPKCFKKYHNKQIGLMIKNCKDVSLLSEDYTGSYKADDGHVVKSTHEVMIDNYLFSHNIIHSYEKRITLSDGSVVCPDFCLCNYKDIGDVYIEHFGFENDEFYENRRLEKIRLYKENHLTVICTYPKDMEDINFSLERKLILCKKGKVLE